MRNVQAIGADIKEWPYRDLFDKSFVKNRPHRLFHVVINDDIRPLFICFSPLMTTRREYPGRKETPSHCRRNERFILHK